MIFSFSDAFQRRILKPLGMILKHWTICGFPRLDSMFHQRGNPSQRGMSFTIDRVKHSLFNFSPFNKSASQHIPHHVLLSNLKAGKLYVWKKGMKKRMRCISGFEATINYIYNLIYSNTVGGALMRSFSFHPSYPKTSLPSSKMDFFNFSRFINPKKGGINLQPYFRWR